MKREFWQDPTTTLLFYLMLSLAIIPFEILGIVLYVTDPENSIVFIVATFILLFAILDFLLGENRMYVTKIIFFDDKIVLKRFNKELNSIKWSEIIKVEEGSYSLARRYIIFVAEDSEIATYPTKKMYQTIISVCPYENLRTMINNLEMFKWYHRKDSKNNHK